MTGGDIILISNCNVWARTTLPSYLLHIVGLLNTTSHLIFIIKNCYINNVFDLYLIYVLNFLFYIKDGEEVSLLKNQNK